MADCGMCQIIGAAAGDNLGRSVSNAGDVNDDGVDDILIGAPGADGNRRTNAGAVYVIFGRKNRLFHDIDLASVSFTASGIGFKVSVIYCAEIAALPVTVIHLMVLIVRLKPVYTDTWSRSDRQLRGICGQCRGR